MLAPKRIGQQKRASEQGLLEDPGNIGKSQSDTVEGVTQNVGAKLAAASALGAAVLDVHISVDPTQIGHVIDPELARRNAFEIAERIAQAARGVPGNHLLMLDMEDASVVDATLALHDALRAAGLPIAITLQAYLHRTRDDLDRLIDSGATVRLVKGAFAAPKAIAYTSRVAIKANSRVLIESMLGARARASGFSPIVATHDAALQEHAARVAQRLAWDNSRWEIEMLLGVRDDLARAQARAGRRVRLYAPFGSDWWPYALRRIGENPTNAWLLARSLLGS